MKKYYIVSHMLTRFKSNEQFIDLEGVHDFTIDATDKGSGIIGVMPVFTNYKKAKKFSKGKGDIIPMTRSE